MNHLIVLPLMLPALVAALALLGMRQRLWIGRSLAMASCLALLVTACVLLGRAAGGDISSYAVGAWAPEIGIVLVLDRLSAAMLVLVALLATVVLAHVIFTGLDRRGWHFHPLFQFQLLGLNGAFLTGDLFNLFVFFEVLLIASYGLLLHGQGAERLRAGFHYVVVNLVGSTLFLVAVGILYGTLGSLNMADLAVRIANAPAEDQGLIRAGAQLLILVFALKAALLPLHLWLPLAYAGAAAPVAALFAVMTKVGVYAILRLTTLVFGAQAGAAAFAPGDWLLPAALLTTVLGYLGLLAADRLKVMAAFAVLGSTGTAMIAVALFTPVATAAALYYLFHSVLAGAALFLIVDLIARRRPDMDDEIASGRRFSGIEGVSLLFFIGALAVVGLPPLSGFVGKLLVLDAAATHAWRTAVWAVLLITTFIGVLGLARAGSLLFWKSSEQARGPDRPTPVAESLGPSGALLALLALLSVLAGPASLYAAATAEQLYAPAGYVRAVLGPTPEQVQ